MEHKIFLLLNLCMSDFRRIIMQQLLPAFGVFIQAFVNAKSDFLNSNPVILIFLTYRSGNPATLGKDMVRMEMEANASQTIVESSNIVNQPWSTIQEPLQQTGEWW